MDLVHNVVQDARVGREQLVPLPTCTPSMVHTDTDNETMRAQIGATTGHVRTHPCNHLRLGESVLPDSYLFQLARRCRRLHVIKDLSYQSKRDEWQRDPRAKTLTGDDDWRAAQRSRFATHQHPPHTAHLVDLSSVEDVTLHLHAHAALRLEPLCVANLRGTVVRLP